MVNRASILWSLAISIDTISCEEETRSCRADKGRRTLSLTS